MARRSGWRTGVFFICALVAAAYAWLDREVPRFVQHALASASGGTVRVGGVRLGWPMRLVLTDVSLVTPLPGATLSARRLIAAPRRWSWSQRTLWLSSLLVEGLHAGVRRTPQGAIQWPMLGGPTPGEAEAASSVAVARPLSASSVGAGWQLVIDTLQIADAEITFVDGRFAQPFEWSLSPLSLIGGPVGLPRAAERFSLAAQGQFVGVFQRAAPLSCSGWLDFSDRNADLACQLSPLPLAAFQPYYDQGPWQVRVYDASLQVTARLTAKQNAMDGRLQLELENLEEGDVSHRGRAVVDVKKVLSKSAQKTLSGEIRLTGPLDQPEQWQFQLVPGDATVQQLMRPLLEHGVASIQVKMGEQVIKVDLAPGSPEAITSVEQASQAVQEQLQVVHPAETMPSLETPVPEEAVSPPAPAAPPPDVVSTPPEPSSPAAPADATAEPSINKSPSVPTVSNGPEEKAGERGDSNPRPPEPQSGALTD